jgi:hypothetical protein
MESHAVQTFLKPCFGSPSMTNWPRQACWGLNHGTPAKSCWVDHMCHFPETLPRCRLLQCRRTLLSWDVLFTPFQSGENLFLSLTHFSSIIFQARMRACPSSGMWLTASYLFPAALEAPGLLESKPPGLWISQDWYSKLVHGLLFSPGMPPEWAPLTSLHIHSGEKRITECSHRGPYCTEHDFSSVHLLELVCLVLISCRFFFFWERKTC